MTQLRNQIPNIGVPLAERGQDGNLYMTEPWRRFFELSSSDLYNPTDGLASTEIVVELGTNTTGDYIATITQGTGVTVTGGTGEAANATISIAQAVATTDTPLFAGISIVGNIIVGGDVDGRDVSVDGTKLDGIEAAADVTDATNVNAAGAVMWTDYSAPTAATPTPTHTITLSLDGGGTFEIVGVYTP